MSERNNPLTVYLTDKEKAQLKKWADETGKSLSELGRDAVMEYIDHDRYDRVEGQLATILDEIEAVRDTLEENPDAHTQTGVYKGNKSVPEKARAVVHHIITNYDMPLKDDDVEIAIENIAEVGDDRSIDKYKRQFKKRDLLFRHPFQPVWTNDKQQWVSWVEQSQVADQSHEVIEDYQMDMGEYDKLANEVTDS